MEILNRLRVMQVRVRELRRESDVLAEQRREAYHNAATKLISTQNVINSVRARLRESGDCSVCGSAQDPWRYRRPRRPVARNASSPSSYQPDPSFVSLSCLRQILHVTGGSALDGSNMVVASHGRSNDLCVLLQQSAYEFGCD